MTRYRGPILLAEAADEGFSPPHLFPEILQQKSIETFLIFPPLNTLAAKEAAKVVIILHTLAYK